MLALCAVAQALAVAGRIGEGAGQDADVSIGLSPGGMVLAPRALGDPVAGIAPTDAPGGVRVVRTPAGVLTPVLGERNGQWLVSTPCGREGLVPIAQPVSDVTVILDPGHGGFEPGAVGPNGLTEKDLNLAVARHAADALRLAGVSVLLTRTADHGMTLANRARLAVDLNAAAIVSVHHNAGAVTPSQEPGSEAYHQVGSAESKRLAGLIWEEAVAALDPHGDHWVTYPGTSVSWRTNSSDEDWYGMLRLPRPVPAVLAELAYLSHEPEAELLADPAVQEAEGQALARGILRFLTTDDQGSGFTEGGPMGSRGPSGADPDRCDDPEL